MEGQTGSRERAPPVYIADDLNLREYIQFCTLPTMDLRDIREPPAGHKSHKNDLSTLLLTPHRVLKTMRLVDLSEYKLKVNACECRLSTP